VVHRNGDPSQDGLAMAGNHQSKPLTLLICTAWKQSGGFTPPSDATGDPERREVVERGQAAFKTQTLDS